MTGRDTKDGERDDYVGNIWEGIWMSKNGDKKGVYLELQAKEGLEQLKARDRSETLNIKAELRSVRDRAERGDQEQYRVVTLQS